MHTNRRSPTCTCSSSLPSSMLLRKYGDVSCQQSADADSISRATQEDYFKAYKNLDEAGYSFMLLNHLPGWPWKCCPHHHHQHPVDNNTKVIPALQIFRSCSTAKASFFRLQRQGLVVLHCHLATSSSSLICRKHQHVYMHLRAASGLCKRAEH